MSLKGNVRNRREELSIPRKATQATTWVWRGGHS